MSPLDGESLCAYKRFWSADIRWADNLDKTKVTGNEQVDNLQDGVNGLVSGQLGQGGLAQPLGDAVSKEGINRAERSGVGDTGSYMPKAPQIFGGLGKQ